MQAGGIWSYIMLAGGIWRNIRIGHVNFMLVDFFPPPNCYPTQTWILLEYGLETVDVKRRGGSMRGTILPKAIILTKARWAAVSIWALGVLWSEYRL